MNLVAGPTGLVLAGVTAARA